jgi:hypothetical protein
MSAGGLVADVAAHLDLRGIAAHRSAHPAASLAAAFADLLRTPIARRE